MDRQSDNCSGASPIVQGRWRYSIHIVTTQDTPQEYEWVVLRERADVAVEMAQPVGNGVESTCMEAQQASFEARTAIMDQNRERDKE